MYSGIAVLGSCAMDMTFGQCFEALSRWREETFDGWAYVRASIENFAIALGGSKDIIADFRDINPYRPAHAAVAKANKGLKSNPVPNDNVVWEP